MKNKNTKSLFLALFLSLVITALSSLYRANFERPFFSSFDYIFFDFKQKFFLNQESTEDKITTVEIDESTLIEFGRWPWPRELTASLIEKIIQKGASRVILDIVFSELSDEKNDLVLKNTIEKYKDKVVLGAYVNSFARTASDLEKKCLQDFIFTKKNAKTTENWSQSKTYHSQYSLKFDEHYKEILTEYLQEKNKSSVFDLADSELFYLTIQHGRRVGDFCNSLDHSRKSHYFQKYTPSNVILNYDDLQSVADKTGVFSVLPDQDGSIRRYYVNYKLVDLAIPTSAGIVDQKNSTVNAFWINYTNKTPIRVEASKILKDEKIDLTGQVVLLGVTSPGVYDIRKTPISEALPGTYILAQAASNLINANYLLYWSYSDLFLFLFLFALSLLLVFHKKMKWGNSVYWFLGVIVVLTTLEFVLFKNNIFFWSFEFYFFWGALFIVNNYLYYKEESSQKVFIKLLFSKYVSDNVVQDILNSPEKINLSGEKKKLSIFFSDIRSFTTLSEKLDPIVISQFLNTYFDPMVETIKTHDGTVDKFIGDGLMAFFGAPIESPHNARNACLSALKCIENLYGINEKIKGTINTEVTVGIGLNLQEVFVGNIGSSNLQSYTVIGDGVNLAARLQALTKKYAVKIIVAESIYYECKSEFIFKKLDQVKVKGRLEPIWIYELCESITSEEADFAQAYEELLNDFFSQNLSKARIKLDQLLMKSPNDTLLGIINSRLVEIEKKPDLNWELNKYGSS